MYPVNQPGHGEPRGRTRSNFTAGAPAQRASMTLICAHVLLGPRCRRRGSQQRRPGVSSAAALRQLRVKRDVALENYSDKSSI